jgi:hypothetical protein
MNKAKQAVVAAGLTAGLLGGGAAGLILGSSGVSGAQDGTTSTTVAEQPASGTESAERPDPAERLRATLDPLVAAGTITQAQEDAVITALTEAGLERGGPGGPGGRHGGRGLDAAATALGVTEDELRTALRDGQTLAQVAESKNVPVQTVIDALIAERKTHLDEKVASGDLTQAEADQRLADATTRITDMVNNGGPAKGEGRGGPPPEDADAGRTTEGSD